MGRLAIIAALLCFLMAAAPPDPVIGRVKIASGPALIRRAGVPMPAKPGLALKSGDILETGANGRIGVTFVDNSRFAAGPNSKIDLTRFTFDSRTHDGEFLTKIDRGSLAVISGQIAKRKRDAMRVRTPTALLGVRGTRFVVTVE